MRCGDGDGVEGGGEAVDGMMVAVVEMDDIWVMESHSGSELGRCGSGTVVHYCNAL